MVEAHTLLHCEETDACGDAGCQGAAKRPDDEEERRKASVRAKVANPSNAIRISADRRAVLI